MMLNERGPGFRVLVRGAIAAVGIVLASCGEDADRPAADVLEDEAHPMEMPPHEMPMDAAMMRRHAEEADSMAAEVRAHLAEMRRLTPAEQHSRMGEHIAAVSRMIGLMDRQMREMSMGMPMDDAAMGAMMGMSAAEHRHMMDELHTLREESERLQLAAPEEIRERMPAHLERVERLVEMMEHGAEHMRRADQP